MATVKKYDDFLNKNTENISEKLSENKLVVDDHIYAHISSYHVSVFSNPKDYDKVDIMIQVDVDSMDEGMFDINVIENGDYSDDEVDDAVELVTETFKKHSLIARGVALSLSNPKIADIN